MQSKRTVRAMGRQAPAISRAAFPFSTVPPLAERSGCRSAKSSVQFKLVSVAAMEPLQWDSHECENACLGACNESSRQQTGATITGWE